MTLKEDSMKTARPWLILFVAVAIAGYGCSSGGSTATTTPSSTPTTTSTAGATGTTSAGSVGSTATSATAGTAVGTGAASAAGLTSSLSSLGLTGDQASGAVGSVLSMAQGKLSASDYTKVAAAVPGANTYVQKAKDLGAVTGPITDASGLDAAYSKLGISPEIGAQVTPLVVNYVGKAAGPAVGGLLSSVVK
jgi:hypothetical protein